MYYPFYKNFLVWKYVYFLNERILDTFREEFY